MHSLKVNVVLCYQLMPYDLGLRAQRRWRLSLDNGKEEPAETGEDNYRERKDLVRRDQQRVQGQELWFCLSQKTLYIGDMKTITVWEGKGSQTPYDTVSYV